MNSNETQKASMDTIYQKLTGVNIDEQLKEWDARGKGYYGEFLLFSEIYNHIPGCFKILMNLQIPSENGRTTEIDLLLIHETGLYVFEAKHYKSTIYGKMDDPRWTQYFKTVENNQFPNPVLQNRWHIEQLRKLIPDCPIYSFIVFTSNDCELKVTGNLSNTTLCKKSAMRKHFEGISGRLPAVLGVKEINDIFVALKFYSPVQDTQVNYKDSKAVSLYQFMDMMSDLYSAKEKACKKKMRIINFFTIAVCVVIVFSLFAVTSGILIFATSSANAKVEESQKLMDQYKDNAEASQAELQKFMQKWEVVTDFQIDGEKLKDDYVVVDSVSLTNSEDFGDIVYLSFQINHNGEDFYVLIDKSSMFTVVLKDGRVIETPCYSGYYSYSLGYSQSTKILKVNKVEFSGFNADDVALIKITNLQIKRIKYVYGDKPLLTDYEIVLYELK